jgi:pimeloyl-ACP methyl ester carboxylesterase
VLTEVASPDGRFRRVGRFPAVRSRNVVSGDVSLAVHEWGDVGSPTIVCIHGYPDTSAVWTPIAERLATRYHVVTYDVRGAGESTRPRHRADYRLDRLMDDLRRVIDATCPDRPLHLVGHDWGSIQGWEAVTEPTLQPRLASYMSLFAPGLDHAALWLSERLGHRRPGGSASSGARRCAPGTRRCSTSPGSGTSCGSGRPRSHGARNA